MQDWGHLSHMISTFHSWCWHVLAACLSRRDISFIFCTCNSNFSTWANKIAFCFSNSSTRLLWPLTFAVDLFSAFNLRFSSSRCTRPCSRRFSSPSSVSSLRLSSSVNKQNRHYNKISVLGHSSRYVHSLIWHYSVNIHNWLSCKLFGSLLIVLSLNWMNQHYHYSNPWYEWLISCEGCNLCPTMLKYDTFLQYVLV